MQDIVVDLIVENYLSEVRQFAQRGNDVIREWFVRVFVCNANDIENRVDPQPLGQMFGRCSTVPSSSRQNIVVPDDFTSVVSNVGSAIKNYVDRMAL